MSQVTQIHYLDWRERTSKINEAIESVHTDNCKTPQFSFSPVFLKISDRIAPLVNTLLSQVPPEQNEFNILIIGQISFKFSDGLLDELTKIANTSQRHLTLTTLSPLPSSIGMDTIKIAGKHFTGHLYTKFNIERLSEELEDDVKLKLMQKTDLIIADFFPSIDPIGTFDQIYAFSRPQTGILITKGLEIHVEKTAYLSNTDFFTSCGIPFAHVNSYTFFLHKKDDHPCRAPYCYGPIVKETSAPHINYKRGTGTLPQLTLEDFAFVEQVAGIFRDQSEEIHDAEAGSSS